jgi:hypothetical protein
MRQKFLALSAFVMVVTFALGPVLPVQAASTFIPNDLIDDSVFDNSSTMTASQIDAWINNNFPSSCISTNHGFQAQDPTGYSPSTGFTYGANVSAGQVIYDAAAGYGLNPQVLLATMQKEQSLVSGGGGCSTLAYTGAMGYGCPDGGTQYSYSGINLYAINGVNQTSVSGTCVNTAAKAGFSEQVIHAAWLLKFGEQRSEGNTSFDVQASNTPQPGDYWNNSDDPTSCYAGPMTEGLFKRCSTDANPVYYDGYTTIDGTSTHMDTGATAALYWYTPHFSGNQNFDSIFTAWFGSPYGNSIGSTLYRLYNPARNDHYYTAINNAREDAIIYQGYVSDGTAFAVSPTPQAGMVPIYAMYNGRLNDHYLTPDGLARYWAYNFGGYQDDGIAFYAYPTATGAINVPEACPANSTPVYTLWNGQLGDHFYTTSGPERYWVYIFAGYRNDTSSTYIDSAGNGSIGFCAPTS